MRTVADNRGAAGRRLAHKGPPCCYTRINAEDKKFFFFLGYLITDNQGSAPGFLKPKQCRYLVIFSYFFFQKKLCETKKKNRVSSKKTKLTSKRIKHPVQLLLYSLFSLKKKKVSIRYVLELERTQTFKKMNAVEQTMKR